MIVKNILLIVLLSFSTLFSVAAQKSGEGLLGDLKQIHEESAAEAALLLPQAEQGDPVAMLALARAYWELVVLTPEEEKMEAKQRSWTWYEKTALQKQDARIAQEAADEVVLNYWYQEEIEPLRPWADRGHVEAQYLLADRLSRNEETMPEAVTWFRKAGENGHVKAIAWLAAQLENGWEIEANLPESLEWYKRGAEAGDLELTYQLARRYHLGYGSRWPEFEKDMVQANTLYLKAGNGGHTKAQAYLAKFFINVNNGGHAEVATEWLIEKDEGAGYFYRGEMFEKGIGREKDLKQAKAFYIKAREREYWDAEHAIGRVEAAMAGE